MNTKNRSVGVIFSGFLLLWGFSSAPAAQVGMQVEAISGEPFGVGRFTVVIPKDLLPDPLGADGLGLSEKNSRVLFPVFNTPIAGAVAKEVLESTPLLTGGPIRQEIRGLLGGILDLPPHTTVYFLFRGKEPLELTLDAKSAHSLSTIAPRDDPKIHRQLLDQWWEQYTAPPKLLQKKADGPPLVENYLKATLARRLNLRLPKREQTDSPRELLAGELGLLLGSESILTALEQDRLLGLHNLGLPADQPLPEPIQAPELEIPEPAAKVEIEPIALRVPAECYYVRFGSFANFLWFQDTLTRWENDLRNLVAARGLDYGMRKNIERQLALQTTELARLLGDTVIADVAFIGADTFFREGGAYGILFQAKSNVALTGGILAQRSSAIKSGGATETKITIVDRDVSYLSTADGSIRSYYAADGDYHFVTTSKTLMQRFLETRSSKNALGTTKEFRHARQLLPQDRKDTVWIYLSDAFFRNLTSPQYRLEMVRRLQSQADIEIVQLAVLAAATEGKPGDSIDKLISGGLLPPDFGPRPDGSQAVLRAGVVSDSLRGWRGSLLPVPDVPVTSATRAELTEYRKFADFYRENWGRMDPAVIGIKRQTLASNREQVVADVHMTPLSPKHFEFLSQWAGPADSTRLAQISGDIARAELVMPSGRVFVGFRDSATPLQQLGSQLLADSGLLDILVGYVGTSGGLPLPAFLDTTIVFPRIPIVGNSVIAAPFRQRNNQFTVYSLQPDLPASIISQLRSEKAPNPAQLRAWIGDPSRARMATLLNNWGYVRTRETSLGNLRLLGQLDQQLHVPAAKCKEAAEFLLGATLFCPLEGQYAFRESKTEIGHWTTTALEGGGRQKILTEQAPAGFLAPPLDWFRGGQIEASMNQNLLSAHAEVIMQLPARKKTL
jgi:hypothetical protein